jgi:hypothetical protein
MDLQRVAQAAKPRQIDLGRPPFTRDDSREKVLAFVPVLGSDEREHRRLEHLPELRRPQHRQGCIVGRQERAVRRDARQDHWLPLYDSAQVGFARAFHVGVV